MAKPQPVIERYLNIKGRDTSVGVEDALRSKTVRARPQAWNLPFPFVIQFYATAEAHDYGRGIKPERFGYIVANLFDYRYLDFRSPTEGQLWPLGYKTRQTPSATTGVLWPRGDKV